MKRVLIFSTAYLPLVGGAEFAVKEITDRISPKEIEFDLICAKLKRGLADREKLGNVNIYRIGKGSSWDKWSLIFQGPRLAQKLHKSRSYAKIWAIMASQGGIAAAKFKAKNRQIPLILTLQEGDEIKHLRRYVFGSRLLFTLLIKPFHESVYKVADQITAISSWLKERAKKVRPSLEPLIIPNGVNLELFSAVTSEDRKAQLRQELRLSKKKKYVITTSRLVEKNDIQSLILSLNYLENNYDLLILGDGKQRAYLERLAKKEGLEKRVVFLGSVKFEEIPDYLSLADVFCRPSLSEGIGSSFLEAMAAKIPVIATAVGGIKDFLKDGVTGFACNVRDPKSIAEQILRIEKNPVLRQKALQKAKDLVSDQYSWEKISKQMQKVFHA